MSFQIKKTKRESPVIMAVHGDGGVGKTTLAASAPKPIFISVEDGLKNIDAAAVDPVPETWTQVLEAVDHIDALPPEQCQTLAIDSLDWIEPLCWAEVVRKGGKRILGKDADTRIEHIEAFGYGKGYAAALDEWRLLTRKLQNVAARGKNVVLIAHSVRKAVKNPEGEDYEQWQMKLHEKAAGLIKELVDVFAFAAHEIVTEKTSGRHKGIATGRRVLKTQPAAGYVAKTRLHLPSSIPLDWVSFEQAVRQGRVSPVERMKSELDTKLVELGDADVEQKARAFVEQRGVSVSSLSDAIATVNAYLIERATGDAPRKAS